MRRRPCLVALVSGLAVLAAVAMPAQAADSGATAGPRQATGSQGAVPPGIGIGLLEAPVSEANDIRARAYIIDHVAPGTTFSRRFQVSNGTSAIVTLQLYPDSAVIQNGQFVAKPGRTPNDLTSWVSISPSQVTLSPQTRAEAVATFHIPTDATSGERYGLLTAELPASPTQGISEAARVGIRIYLSVGSGSAPASDFTITSLTAQRLPDRTPEVVAQVRNTGGRALDLSGTLNLTGGPGGLSAGPFPTATGITLGIGATQPIVVKLDPRLPDGPWTATMTLHSGEVQHAAEATISFPTQAGTASAAVTAKPKKGHHHVLLPLIAALLWIAIVALLFLAWKRRKRDEEGEQPPAKVRAGSRRPTD